MVKDNQDKIQKLTDKYTGIIDKEVQFIDAPIARKDDSIIERCVSENGDRPITEIDLSDHHTPCLGTRSMPRR